MKSVPLAEYELKMTREKENHDRNQYRKVEAINELPKYFEIDGFENIMLRRGISTYNPKQSRRIIGSKALLVNKERRVIFISEYITTNGNLRIKKFTEDMHKIFFQSEDVEILLSIFGTPRDILKAILDRKEEIEILIENPERYGVDIK